MSGVQASRLPLHYCIGSPTSTIERHGDVESTSLREGFATSWNRLAEWLKPVVLTAPVTSGLRCEAPYLFWSCLSAV